MSTHNGRRASDKAASHRSAPQSPSTTSAASAAERFAVGTSGDRSHGAAHDDPHVRPYHRLDPARLSDSFDALVARTIAAAGSSTGESQPDLTFGPLASIASFVHSARCHDGQMLQSGLALVTAEHPDLAVLTRDIDLPLTDAAQALIARNRPEELSGIRLGCEVYATEHYRPDLILVDETRRFAVVCDIKRSVASYNGSRLQKLKTKLLAAAVVAPDHLRTRHRMDGIRTCHAAILDLSGHADLCDADVFGIDALDGFLGMEGAAAAMHDLKTRFAQAVQAALCDLVSAAWPQVASTARGVARSSGLKGMRRPRNGLHYLVDDALAADLSGPEADDAADEDGNADTGEARLDRAQIIGATSGRAMRRHRRTDMPPLPTVSVALARPAGSA